ncbi:MAG: hypothetical protein PW786_10035 [Arachidicoccus sp.]|nr:hypothetical protein [Arachidicoccus sp.]
MRRILLTVIFIYVVGTSGFSQSEISVSQISSDADAIVFVRQQNYDKETAPQWNHFYLTEGNEWQSFYNLSKAQIDSLHRDMQTFRWQKADLNRDGKPDLIVSGYIARRPGDWSTTTFKLLVFLSQRGNDYQEMNLIDDKLDKYPAYFSLVNIENQNYLQLYRWHIDSKAAENIPLRSDTLTYNATLGYFVHLSGYLNPLTLQRIDYDVQENTGGSHHHLSIENMNGASFPMSITFVRPEQTKPEIFKAKLTKLLWNNLDTLVRNIQFTGDSIIYNDETEGDKLPITLTLQFSNGSKKVIIDYDADASYTLMTIYQVFEDIINNTLDLYEQRQQQIQQNVFSDWDW